jgi:hypothetical protein
MYEFLTTRSWISPQVFMAWPGSLQILLGGSECVRQLLVPDLWSLVRDHWSLYSSVPNRGWAAVCDCMVRQGEGVAAMSGWTSL